MAEIKLEHVTKKFGKVIAVDDFNLTVKDREFLTLVGPSGCGKSTTLNIIAGLEDPSSGYIYIDGDLANVKHPGKRNIAMVFQSYALYPHMNVFENIGFGLRVRGMKKDEVKKRIEEAAELLGIDDLLDRKPRELSGGQRQRVALGRAIVRDPAVFLLDEPLSNLDAKLRIQMRADLRLLFERLEGTVVYVTHDQAEAMTLSDRLVIMKDGLVQQVGPPAEVYDKRDGSGFLKTDDFEIKLNDKQISAIDKTASSNELVIGIRPEDIRIGGEGCTISCKIEVIENMGSESIYYFRVGERRIVATAERMDDSIGGRQECRIGFNMAKLHVFDRKTEQAAF